MSLNKYGLILLAGALPAGAACSRSAAVPSQLPSTSVSAQSIPDRGGAQPLDSTSILKKLKKDVVIGSTVDPTNGDTGPRSISIVQNNFGLAKGQLVFCNFADKTGKAGKGTTIDVLGPKPGSKPSTFVASDDVEGCAGVAVTKGNGAYAAAASSGLEAGFNSSGKLIKTYGPPLAEPFSDADAHCGNDALSFCGYAAEYIFVGDAATGSIVSFSINNFGDRKEIQGVTGFDVNKASGWNILGPSGLTYDRKLDELYVADGVDDAIVAITHASNLLVKDEVVIQPGSKTFKCKYHQKGAPCAKLIYAGSHLDAPVAMTMLPNGNLIAANTAHNSLVEISAAGDFLAKKIIDKSATPHIFGLAAAGTNDANTVLYYTDTKDNTLHELEQ